jgi:hypothetical protein
MAKTKEQLLDELWELMKEHEIDLFITDSLLYIDIDLMNRFVDVFDALKALETKQPIEII